MLHYAMPGATVQQVLMRYYTPAVNDNTHVRHVLQRLKQCRTAALGYHIYQCSNADCGHIKYQYHSCRDRHCPNCGAIKKQEWIEARSQELLPVKYYHVVFTLPHELNRLVMGNRKFLYKLLFDASAQTLLCFAKDKNYLGAQPGIISVLHTWGQQLSFHPHIHCIVSGGGITDDHCWKDAVKNIYRFLFPIKALSIVFRAKFLQGLQWLISSGELKLVDINTAQLIHFLYTKDWVVYAKAPFAGPQAVIEYLGRYTHKVAISNHRITGIDQQKQTVSFTYKDYADNGKQKQMILDAQEFIRRFQQHILPERFTKIRSYGYLSNRNRHQYINAILKAMKLPQHKGMVKIPLEVRMKEMYGIDIQQCPCCKKTTLKLLFVFVPWKQTDDG